MCWSHHRGGDRHCFSPHGGALGGWWFVVQFVGPGSSTSSLAVRLIEEGVRMQEHAAVCSRDDPAGRRAALVGSPGLVDVVSTLAGGDVPAAPAEGQNWA